MKNRVMEIVDCGIERLGIGDCGMGFVE